MKLAVALFLSLFVFFMWWGLNKPQPLKFRGIGVENSMEYELQSNDFHFRLASFCNDLPMCFRPFSSWITLGVYYSLSNGYEYLGNQVLLAEDHFRKYPEIRKKKILLDVATSATTSFAYIFSFATLFYLFPYFSGFAALFSFGLIPITVNIAGLVHHDPWILLIWSIFFLTYPKLKENWLDVENSKKNRIAILYFVFLGLISTWIVENMGIAFSIALFIILGIDFLKNKKKRNIVYFFTVSFFTLLAMGISWILTHRHEDLYWIQPGKGIEAIWEVYSKEDKFLDLIRFSWYMIRVPFIIGSIFILLKLTTLLVRSKESLVSFSDKYKYLSILSFSGVFGFFCTCLAGLWMGAGFRYEWSRQLMPLSFLFTIFYFSFILYVSSLIIMYYKKRKWEIT